MTKSDKWVNDEFELVWCWKFFFDIFKKIFVIS